MKTNQITPGELNIVKCEKHYKWLFWTKKKRLAVNIDLMTMKVTFVVWRESSAIQDYDDLTEAIKFYNAI